MTFLVESIPNISEGRDVATLARFEGLLSTDPNVHLLHTHPDADHNRTVFTLVGEAGRLTDMLMRLYGMAIETIDMRRHRGVHPRLGAVDVCPFVPLPQYATSMDDCVCLASALGARVGDELGLPVYLYRESATRPSRRELAAVRRGQFEGLEAKMQHPEWAPDHGPPAPHPAAGATIIGARNPLVACNVWLATDRLSVAREIAAEVRESSGGLPFVRAMGVELRTRGCIQVSLNIENLDRSPLHVVVNTVRAAARARGLVVKRTELVGLMPMCTAIETAADALQLPDLDADRLLENAIARRCGNA